MARMDLFIWPNSAPHLLMGPHATSTEADGAVDRLRPLPQPALCAHTVVVRDAIPPASAPSLRSYGVVVGGLIIAA